MSAWPNQSAESDCKVLETFLNECPKFHRYDGVLTNWGIHPETLRFLYTMLTPEMSTLETGCGYSTVVFSIAGTRHTCITPDAEEATRVQRYCAELGLGKNITFLIGSSDDVLKTHDSIPGELDVIIIDGAHRFPFPILDWHYTANRLKPGGVVAIDDFMMPSVHVLYQFLTMEEEWQLVRALHNTAFFRKLREPDSSGDWQHQKINKAYQPTQRQSMTQLVIDKIMQLRFAKQLRRNFHGRG